MNELIATKKYFIFDLDGTLVDLEDLNYSAFKKAVDKYFDTNLSFNQYLQYFAGAGSRKGFERFIEGEKIENKYDITEVQKHYRSIKREELTNNFSNVVKVKAGAENFLKSLKEKGFKVALGTSNAREFASLIVKNAGLEQYFDASVFVEDVTNTKPAPDIFLKCMELIGGNVNESLIFEDSPTGILAAKNSKIDYVVIHTAGKNDIACKDEKYVVEDYLEI